MQKKFRDEKPKEKPKKKKPKTLNKTVFIKLTKVSIQSSTRRQDKEIPLENLPWQV
jgi:hypothetical protein